MNKRCAYLGSFEITSGVIDIADPYVNSIAVAVERIPYANEKMVRATRSLSGVYEALHIIDVETNIVCGLLVVQCSYSVADIFKSKSAEKIGVASSGLSNALVVVDERYRFDTSYCYNAIEPNSYYDSELIITNLPYMHYSDDLKLKLAELANSFIDKKDDTHPKGCDILDIVGDTFIWEGFREFKLCSSQWSTDIINRLRSVNTSGIGIKGGVISEAPGGYVDCYSYSNHRGDIYSLYVSFAPGFVESNGIWNIIE